MQRLFGYEKPGLKLGVLGAIQCRTCRCCAFFCSFFPIACQGAALGIKKQCHRILSCSITAVFAGVLQPALANSNPPEIVTPSAVQTGLAASSDQRWWTGMVADRLVQFLSEATTWDKVPAATTAPYDMAERVRVAVLAHPDVRLAGERKLIATQAKQEAYAGFFPKVSASLESRKRKNAVVNAPWTYSIADESTSKALALSANQLVYDFGALNFQVTSLSALERGAVLEAELKTSEVTLQACVAWMEIFRTRQILKLAQINVEARQHILNLIQQRGQFGVGTKSEVLRARSRLADAKAFEVEALKLKVNAEAVFREIFNESPPVNQDFPVRPYLDLVGYQHPNDFYEKNPLLSQAKARTQAAELQAKSAAAAQLPVVSFDLSARRRDLDSPGVPGTDWTAGLVVKKILYSGGADAARKQQADLHAVEAQLAQDGVRRKLERMYAQAISDVDLRMAAMALRKEAVNVAALALQAVSEQFSNNRASPMSLLQVEEELFAAGRLWIDSAVEEVLARFRMLHVATELNEFFDVAILPLGAFPNSRPAR